MFQVACNDSEETRLLINELGNSTGEVREAAVIALGNLVGKIISTNDAVGIFISALKDKDPMVQCKAVGALGRLGPAASNAVPFMIPLLNGNEKTANGRVYVRAFVAISLAKIGTPASNAAPQLKSLMANGDTYQRLAAAFALWSVSSNVDDTVPVFIKDMAGYDKGYFFPATALLEMGPRAKAAYPALAAEVGKRGGDNQMIVDALKAIDPESAARDGIK